MTVFKLPDLGEGLPDAEIVSWLVKEGDEVCEGDNMVEMSTAKAVVEVPVPYSGKIIKLHGGPGDVIKTGAPLVTFQLEGEEAVKEEPEAAPKADPEAKKEESRQEPEPRGAGEVFKLPDLGEGLPDAEIIKWLIKQGDIVTEGDNMVEMSTAKAVVEIPAPFSGKVIKLYGGPGDVIKTGAPLIEIDTGGKAAPAAEPEVKLIKEAKGDSGTVVGAVVIGDEVTSETRADAAGIKASAAVRAQARKLKIGLASITGTGPDGAITLADLKKGGAPAKAAPAAPAAPATPETPEIPGDVSISPSAKATARALDLDVSGIVPKQGRKVVTKGDVLRAARARMAGEVSPSVMRVATSREVKAAPKVREVARAKGIDLKTLSPTGHLGNITLDDVIKSSSGAPVPAVAQPYSRPARPYEVSGKAEKLVGPRRFMAQGMARASSEVCHTSIFDEAPISAWPKGADITVRIMRAIIAACYAEPALNAWFDGENMEKTTHKHVNLGVAVDNPRGLFVPVLKGADDMDGPALRAELNRLRGAISDGSIKMGEMSGATITLSNFGMIAGRFATPIVSPPEVAIVGIGGLFEKLVMTEKGIENQRVMPVSITFDHRACSGGEAARFLSAILADLTLAY